MTTVLVVDDEPIVREVVVSYLQREGYRTLEAADGDRARELLEAESPGLVVLDVMLPGTDGLELCRWIRARSELPVIMLTARGEEADRIVGLELGADDYVTKPFSAAELVARMRAVLRRSTAEPTGPSGGVVTSGDLVMNLDTRTVTRDRQPVDLTVKEFELLRVLLESAGRLVKRDDLVAEVWDANWFGSTKTLDVHVSSLRKKLGDDPAAPRYIHTVRGVGFRFSPADELEP
jgi:two-component system response regulator RegX3